mmetsp:Transcript_22000/g.51173  ORF Transcript_22000/g.51173 Transcript_22000/m.51173 type:complete len:290 (+) Transcript_22000:468-1337(+)
MPLFSFHVTDLSGRSFLITRTIDDFDSLHARLASYGQHESLKLPKLPGKKKINANTHAHLQKRVRRYAEYLEALLTLGWSKNSAIVAAFVTDEGIHTDNHSVADIEEGSHEHALHGTCSGSAVGGWEDLGEAEKLREEVERLRKRVAELQRGHRAWSNTLQHLLVVTLFHPRREEDHRVRLEKLLKRAVEENPSGKVSEVECSSVRTPKTSDGIPHFSLRQASPPFHLISACFRPPFVACEVMASRPRNHCPNRPTAKGARGGCDWTRASTAATCDCVAGSSGWFLSVT